MSFDFGNLVNNLKEAKYGFTEISEWISSVYENVIANATVLEVWDNFVTSNAFISYNLKFILLACSLAIAFFGKRIANLIKFVAVFVSGFCLTVCYVSPLLDRFVEIPYWIMGVVVASVLAVLCRYIYLLLMALAVAYPVYYAVLRPDVLTSFLSGNVIIALGVAAGVLLLVLIFKKYAEFAGFAFLGGLFAALVIRSVYDYTALVIENGEVFIYILALLIAIPGYMIQYKTRKRY